MKLNVVHRKSVKLSRTSMKKIGVLPMVAVTFQIVPNYPSIFKSECSRTAIFFSRENVLMAWIIFTPI